MRLDNSLGTLAAVPQLPRTYRGSPCDLHSAIIVIGFPRISASLTYNLPEVRNQKAPIDPLKQGFHVWVIQVEKRSAKESLNKTQNRED